MYCGRHGAAHASRGVACSFGTLVTVNLGAVQHAWLICRGLLTAL